MKPHFESRVFQFEKSDTISIAKNLLFLESVSNWNIKIRNKKSNELIRNDDTANMAGW